MSAVTSAFPPAGSVKLAGALIGSTGSYRNQGNVGQNAFDGNAATFYDASTATGAWVGEDLGSPELITQVQYVPRSGFSSRMVGGTFQGSTTADFSSGVVSLYTITSVPGANAFTTMPVSNSNGFEFVRYLSPFGGECNVAELEFDGTPAAAPPPTNSTYAVADSPTDVKVSWSTDKESIATSFTILRQGPADAYPVGIATALANTTSFDDATALPATNYSYEVIPNNGSNPLPALTPAVVTTPAVPVIPLKLTGSLIGTGGSYHNSGNTIAKVLDGSFNTYFDAPVGSGNWVGMDFGSPQAIMQIKFAPRGNFAGRMAGGMFQVSDTEDFSADVTTVFTISSAPAYKTLTTVNVTTNGGFRYARYLSPSASYGNIAELEFDGLPSAAVQGTAIPVAPAAFPGNITWSNDAASPIIRAEAVGGSVNGILYVFGGFNDQGSDTTSIPLQSECDSYNPATNTWTRLQDFPEPFTHSEEVIVGTNIWFIGGYIGNHPGPGTTHVWVYDTTKDSWSRGPDLPQARGAGAAALVGNTIYFSGGMDLARTIDENSTFALDLTNPSAGWTQLADLPNGRNHVAAAGLGGYFYVIGGQHGQEDGQAAQNEVDRYDPSTNTWMQVASLPVLAGKSHITEGTLVYDGRIIVIGGETGYNNPQKYVVDYDPATDTWNQLGVLPAARSTVVAGIINGQLVITTGNSPGPTTTTWIGSFS